MINEIWVVLVDGRLKSGVLGVYTSFEAACGCIKQSREWFPDRTVRLEYMELNDDLTKSQMTSVIIGTDFDDDEEEEDEP